MNPVDPTPEQIAARAAIIRESWDEREHARRAGINPDAGCWLVPRARIGDGRQEPKE